LYGNEYCSSLSEIIEEALLSVFKPRLPYWSGLSGEGRFSEVVPRGIGE
jgi:hypothetical protein